MSMKQGTLYPKIKTLYPKVFPTPSKNHTKPINTGFVWFYPLFQFDKGNVASHISGGLICFFATTYIRIIRII